MHEPICLLLPCPVRIFANHQSRNICLLICTLHLYLSNQPLLPKDLSSQTNSSNSIVLFLRTQAKTASASDALRCHYCSNRGRIFQDISPLYDHAIKEHPFPFKFMNPEKASAQLQDAALRMEIGTAPHSEATISGGPATQPSLHLKSTMASGHQQQQGLIESPKHDPRFPGLLLQPDSRPISPEKLWVEVKSIYAGLAMVEAKCIHVDRAQVAALQNPLDPNSQVASDQWQALIALHRTLLHEHHDFFLASQHPSASAALRRLAAKYSMPARMWKHGIHSFLELLRRRLPESIDYMLSFIYLAYQMMALLYETVPAFEDTWIECLGDLGRYRMAIEDEDIHDRKTWAAVARLWYSKAADKNPSVGRLYHHLAILARPDALQQLYYYSRSLNCIQPFASARESILTLLDPILGRSNASYSSALPVDISFIQAHGLLFEKLSAEKFEDARLDFHSQLKTHIGRVAVKWKEQGAYIAVTNLTGLFDYGNEESILRQVINIYARQKAQPTSTISDLDEEIRPPTDVEIKPPTFNESEIPAKIETLSTEFIFSRAYLLTMETLSLTLRRIGDKNVLPHVHIILAFLSSFASIHHVTQLIDHAPWTELVAFLNELIKPKSEHTKPGPVFPLDRTDSLPLPEDYLIRGQIWCQWYFPKNWFAREHDEKDWHMEHDQKDWCVEHGSTMKARNERVLQLGFQLADLHRWISFDPSSNTFTVVNLTNRESD